MWRLSGELLLHYQFPIIHNIGNIRRRLLARNCRFGAKLLIDYCWSKIIYKIILRYFGDYLGNSYYIPIPGGKRASPLTLTNHKVIRYPPMLLQTAISAPQLPLWGKITNRLLMKYFCHNVILRYFGDYLGNSYYITNSRGELPFPPTNKFIWYNILWKILV